MNIKRDVGEILAIIILLLFLSGVAAAPSSNASVARRINVIYYRLALQPRPTVKLAVKFHHQEHALSCEAAALLMALNYKGVKVTESQLISKLQFDRTPKRGNIWGDPNVGFVGDINGKMPSTGYGVHWGPLNHLAHMYRPTQIIVGWSPSQVASEIQHGNPIIMWGVAGHHPQKITWKTPSGKTVKAALYEHTRVIMGFRGSVTRPTGFYVMDPIYGQIYYSTGALYKNWEYLDVYGVLVR